MSDPTRILDIEHQLAEDESGQVRDLYCNSFEEERRELKRAMDRGLSVEEFQQCSQYVSALETADRIVKRVWSSEHRG